MMFCIEHRYPRIASGICEHVTAKLAPIFYQLLIINRRLDKLSN